MKLIFSYEQDSIEVYEMQDDDNIAVARIRICHNIGMVGVYFLDFSDKVKENIFPLLRMFKDDLNIDGYKLNPELIAYNDYTDRYNTDIIE
jgi:hypothetical protein